MKKNGFLGAVFFLCFLGGWPQTAEAADRYDAFLGNVIGSTRLVGLAGAHRTESGGFEAALFNPAGLSWMKAQWDGDLSLGFFHQDFKTRDSFVSAADKTFFYFQAGVAHRFDLWRNLSIGVGVHNPYGMGLSGPADSGASGSSLSEEHRVNFSFDYTSVVLPISLKLRDYLSFGVSLKSSFASMRFSSATENDSTVNLEETASALGFGMDVGLIYKHDSRQTYGLTFLWGESLNFDETPNVRVVGFDPFRGAKRPHQLFLGSSFDWNARLRSYHDLGIIFGASDTVFPGSGISTGVPAISSGQSTRISYHLGVEYDLIPQELQLRAGHYYQPARSALDPQRFHITAGGTYRFWVLELAAAADWAKDYYNVSLSVGPNF